LSSNKTADFSALDAAIKTSIPSTYKESFVSTKSNSIDSTNRTAIIRPILSTYRKSDFTTIMSTYKTTKWVSNIISFEAT
jgi:hypothetical protein